MKSAGGCCRETRQKCLARSFEEGCGTAIAVAIIPAVGYTDSWSNGDIVDILNAGRRIVQTSTWGQINYWWAMDVLAQNPAPNVQNFAHAIATKQNPLMYTVPTNIGTPIYGRMGEPQDHTDIGKGFPAFDYIKSAARSAGMKFGGIRPVIVKPSPNASGSSDGDIMFQP